MVELTRAQEARIGLMAEDAESIRVEPSETEGGPVAVRAGWLDEDGEFTPSGEPYFVFANGTRVRAH